MSKYRDENNELDEEKEEAMIIPPLPRSRPPVAHSVSEKVVSCASTSTLEQYDEYYRLTTKLFAIQDLIDLNLDKMMNNQAASAILMGKIKQMAYTVDMDSLPDANGGAPSPEEIPDLPPAVSLGFVRRYYPNEAASTTFDANFPYASEIELLKNEINQLNQRYEELRVESKAQNELILKAEDVYNAQMDSDEFGFVPWVIYLLCCGCCCGRTNIPDTYQNEVGKLKKITANAQKIFDRDRANFKAKLFDEKNIECSSNSLEIAYEEDIASSPPSAEEAEETMSRVTTKIAVKEPVVYKHLSVAEHIKLLDEAHALQSHLNPVSTDDGQLHQSDHLTHPDLTQHDIVIMG